MPGLTLIHQLAWRVESRGGLDYVVQTRYPAGDQYFINGFEVDQRTFDEVYGLMVMRDEIGDIGGVCCGSCVSGTTEVDG